MLNKNSEDGFFKYKSKEISLMEFKQTLLKELTNFSKFDEAELLEYFAILCLISSDISVWNNTNFKINFDVLKQNILNQKLIYPTEVEYLMSIANKWTEIDIELTKENKYPLKFILQQNRELFFNIELSMLIAYIGCFFLGEKTIGATTLKSLLISEKPKECEIIKNFQDLLDTSLLDMPLYQLPVLNNVNSETEFYFELATKIIPLKLQLENIRKDFSGLSSTFNTHRYLYLMESRKNFLIMLQEKTKELLNKGKERYNKYGIFKNIFYWFDSKFRHHLIPNSEYAGTIPIYQRVLKSLDSPLEFMLKKIQNTIKDYQLAYKGSCSLVGNSTVFREHLVSFDKLIDNMKLNNIESFQESINILKIIRQKLTYTIKSTITPSGEPLELFSFIPPSDIVDCQKFQNSIKKSNKAELNAKLHDLYHNLNNVNLDILDYLIKKPEAMK